MTADTLAVAVILENGFASVASIQQVIDRSRVFDPQLPAHGRNAYGVAALVSIVRTDPFG